MHSQPSPKPYQKKAVSLYLLTTVYLQNKRYNIWVRFKGAQLPFS